MPRAESWSRGFGVLVRDGLFGERRGERELSRRGRGGNENTSETAWPWTGRRREVGPALSIRLEAEDNHGGRSPGDTEILWSGAAAKGEKARGERWRLMR